MLTTLFLAFVLNEPPALPPPPPPVPVVRPEPAKSPESRTSKITAVSAGAIAVAGLLGYITADAIHDKRMDACAATFPCSTDFKPMRRAKIAMGVITGFFGIVAIASGITAIVFDGRGAKRTAARLRGGVLRF